MGSNWIEIAKCNDLEFSISFGLIFEDLLNHGFGMSVRVEWLDWVGLFSIALISVDRC